MNTNAIALQLYTLRDLMKTPAQIVRTLNAVRAIGYTHVELAGLGPFTAQELAKTLDGEGLRCCGAHVPIEKMRADVRQVIADYQLLNCPTVAIPGCWGKSLPEFESFAVEVNTFVEAFENAQLPLGYHNHSHELVRHGERTILSMLMEKCSPKMWFEIDVYWITHGGGDPTDWIGRAAGRVPCVHFKDMAIGVDGKQYFAEIGEGNLNWPAIIRACRAAGAKWLVVEQDVCRRDPMESIAISFANMSRLLAE